MARVFRSQKGQARLQQESGPFSRHREECIVARRLMGFYRGLGGEVFESCMVGGSKQEVAQRKDRQEILDNWRDPLKALHL
jgi:hypothetical protein